MSLARKATVGAALTVAFGLLARGIGVIGTLVMTHLVHPDVIGEVSAATIIVMVFGWFTNWGVGQYSITRGRSDASAEVTWHCTVASVVMTVIAFWLVGAVGGHFMSWFGASAGKDFIPGMAFALGLRRIAAIPEKILVREMRFRALGISMAVGEGLYAVVSVYFAWLGYGGKSVVYGNIAQSVAILLILVSEAGFRSWLTPTPLSRARFADMFRYGGPRGIEVIAHNASRYCDNLLMSRYFGPGPMALYNLGYNLADIPAVYVGEQIGSVLLPSLSRMEPEQRPAALIRASGLMALIIFPMGVGLAAVARPLVDTLLAPEWREVAPLLTVLSALAIFRPVGWIFSSYFDAAGFVRTFMYLELAKLPILLGSIALLQRFGIEVASCGVGIAFGAHAAGSIWAVSRGKGPRPRASKITIAFLRPAMACGIMAVFIVLANHVMLRSGLSRPGPRLTVEIIVGVLSYIAGAWLVAKPIAADFLSLCRGLLKRRTSEG